MNFKKIETNFNFFFLFKFQIYPIMAPVSAAERQHKDRERLKAAGTYNEYKLRNTKLVGLIKLKNQNNLQFKNRR